MATAPNKANQSSNKSAAMPSAMKEHNNKTESSATGKTFPHTTLTKAPPPKATVSIKRPAFLRVTDAKTSYVSSVQRSTTSTIPQKPTLRLQLFPESVSEPEACEDDTPAKRSKFSRPYSDLGHANFSAADSISKPMSSARRKDQSNHNSSNGSASKEADAQSGSANTAVQQHNDDESGSDEREYEFEIICRYRRPRGGYSGTVYTCEGRNCPYKHYRLNCIKLHQTSKRPPTNKLFWCNVGYAKGQKHSSSN